MVVDDLDVRDVDAHAERLRADHDHPLVGAELAEGELPLLGGELAVIGHRDITHVVRDLADMAGVRGIDDGLQVMGGDIPDELDGLLGLAPLVAGREVVVVVDDEPDVLALDLAEEEVRVVHVQAAHAVHDHVVGPAVDGRRGERHDREVDPAVLADPVDVVPQVPVVHAEVAPPRGDEVGLVDHHETEPPFPDEEADVIGEEELRGQVQDVDLPVLAPLDGPVPVDEGEVAVQEGDLVELPVPYDGCHLVIHQDLQGRDHDRHVPAVRDMERRQLEQEGFPRPGGRRDEDVVGDGLASPGLLVFVDDGVDHLPLRYVHEGVALAGVPVHPHLAESGVLAPVPLQQADGLLPGDVFLLDGAFPDKDDLPGAEKVQEAVREGEPPHDLLLADKALRQLRPEDDLPARPVQGTVEQHVQRVQVLVQFQDVGALPGGELHGNRLLEEWHHPAFFGRHVRTVGLSLDGDLLRVVERHGLLALLQVLLPRLLHVGVVTEGEQGPHVIMDDDDPLLEPGEVGGVARVIGVLLVGHQVELPVRPQAGTYPVEPFLFVEHRAVPVQGEGGRVDDLVLEATGIHDVRESEQDEDVTGSPRFFQFGADDLLQAVVGIGGEAFVHGASTG